MKLVKADINKVQPNLYKKSNNLKLLEEFINSGEDCMEVVDYTQKKTSGCVWSLNNSIRIYSLGGIRAICRDKRVYLVKVND